MSNIGGLALGEQLVWGVAGNGILRRYNTTNFTEYGSSFSLPGGTYTGLEYIPEPACLLLCGLAVLWGRLKTAGFRF
jgi:hypothetical protein